MVSSHEQGLRGSPKLCLDGGTRKFPQGPNSFLKKSERKANPAKDGLAGAEARLILLTLLARLKSLLKKSERKANPVKDGLAGAKARIILLTLLARLKPCRCYKAARLSFSQAVKPCRCYKAARLSFSASCKAVPLLQSRSVEFFSKL
jgi:hypothetical protein